MFRKVLIANRGEIALRISRACREMGIRTVAVYSDADRAAAHVLGADEACRLGPPEPSESYLAVDKVLEAARRFGADAVHPGYGFLSENTTFAEACEAAGIRFIGPSSEAIRRMGDKLEARRGANEFDVPVIPGTLGENQTLEDLIRAAPEIGFPVMLKAVGGGGGKGMRIVERPEDLEAAARTAASEAKKAFGNDELYLERCVTGARHVEVQVARDVHGASTHLFERECSVQRRHQKLIEEAPAAISPELRDRMTSAAVRIADGIDYVTVGTVEFLVQGDDFHFLEMNTRLQVEHPVTELITGVDLVKLQIRLAAGEPLGLAASDLEIQGHAIEARICAEDPEASFRPSFGTVTDVRLPGGPGIRIDADLRVGTEVSVYYDPLVAKIIAHGPDRAACVDRLRHALRELQVGGIRTTAPFLAEVLGDPGFRDRPYDTGYIPEYMERRPPLVADSDGTGAATDVARTLAALAALVHDASRSQGGSATPDDGESVAESPWISQGRVAQMRGVRG